MTFTNSKGIKYYLHKRNTVIGRNKIATLTYFFRKEIWGEEYCAELPVGWTVKETHSGLPIVKKL